MSDGIPEGWNKPALGDVATVIMGQSPSSSTYNTEAVGLPFFQGKADFGNHSPIVRMWCSEPTKVAPPDAILFSVRAPVGDVNITRDECCIGRGLSAIVSKTVDQSFLYQYLLFSKAKFQLLSQGSTFEAINGSEMREFNLLSPPKPEQQKIASILTSVDEVIENTEAQISKLQDLKKGMMQELLTKGISHTEFKDSPVGRIPSTWTVLKAGEFLSQRKEKGKEGLPIYSVLMDGGMVDRTTLERRVVSDLKPQDNLLVRQGDLVYNMMRMWQGASGVAPVECMVSPAYVVCRPKNGVSPEFIGYLMKSPHSIQKLHQYSQGLTGDRLRLYFDSFARIRFALPHREEQEKIAAGLSAIDQRIDTKNRQLTSSQRLKSAMMQDLLTGKVRVKVN